MKRILSFAAILILSTGIAAAVTVTGNLGLITGDSSPGQRITFKTDGPTVDGVSIRLPRSAQTSSDANGDFTINLIPGQYDMAVEGLRILTFPVAADATLVNLNQPINAQVVILLGTNSLYKVKVSASDTNAAYLSSKLVAGANVTITTNNPGADETLTIASIGTGGGGAGTVTSVSAGSSKIVVTDGEADPVVDVVEANLNLANIGGTLPPTKLQGGINATNIGAGAVNSTEFGYIDGLTSSAQTQLDARQPLDGDLTAVAGLSETGLIARTGTSMASPRTITAADATITVTNGDGVSGNPTIGVGVIPASKITSGTIDNDRLTAISSVNAGIVPAPTAAFQLLQSDGSGIPKWDTNYPPMVTPSLTIESNAVFQAETANTLAYFNAAKALKSVTLGTGLELSGGMLTATATGGGSTNWVDSGENSTLAGTATVGALVVSNSAPGTTLLTVSQLPLTGAESNSAVNLSTTWNTTGNPSALKLVITDTASGASSKAFEVLGGAAGTTALFSVSKAGGVGVSGKLLSSVPYSSTSANVAIGDSSGGISFSSGGSYFASGGNSLASIASLGLLVSSSKYLAFSGGSADGVAADTILLRDAANTLALRNGVNAQAFNIYNTYTDASNYERGVARWTSGNFEIGIENSGTGADRAVRIKSTSGGSVFIAPGAGNRWQFAANGHFLASTDNTYGIGAPGATRPLYVITGPSGGIGTTGTNATVVVSATGATNTLSVNTILYVTAATGASLTDNAGTTEFSGVTIAAFTPIRLQPGGKFVATGVTYATGTSSHAW